tara:strand:- start:312 stop:482 length:171 start_codon:yes stop_codon:yes gene_type:complete
MEMSVRAFNTSEPATDGVMLLALITKRTGNLFTLRLDLELITLKIKEIYEKKRPWR